MTSGAVLTIKIPALLDCARVCICSTVPAGLNSPDVCCDRLKICCFQPIPPRHRGTRDAVPQNTAQTAARILDHSQIRGPRKQPGRSSAVAMPGDPVARSAVLAEQPRPALDQDRICAFLEIGCV